MPQGDDLDLESTQVRSGTHHAEDGVSQTYSSRPPYPAKQNKAYLHGLRGLAALIVYTAHNISWWYGPSGPIEEGFGYHGHYMIATFPFIRTFFSGGAAAVAVFFVLSGYVLSLSTLHTLRAQDEHGGKQRELWRGLVSATIRRPFRLYVPLAGVSFAFAILMQLPVIAPYMIWPVAEPSLIAELWRWVKEMVKIMNPLRKYGGSAIWFRYNMAAWTMSAEFKGSLAVFALLGIYSHAPARFRFALFAVTGWVFLYFVGEWVVACFMWGVCLAMLDLKRELKRATTGSGSGLAHNKTKTAFFTALFLLSWYVLGQPANLNPERSAATPGFNFITYHTIPLKYLRFEHWRYWNTIGATGLVYSLSHLPLLQHLLALPTMQFLGKISFTLYLVHIPVLWTVGDRIFRMLGVQRGDFVTWFDDLLKVPDVGPLGFSTGWIIAQMLVYPITASLALVLVKYLDEPSVRIGKHVAARLMPAFIKREDKIVRILTDLLVRLKIAKLTRTAAAFFTRKLGTVGLNIGGFGIGGGGGGGGGSNATELPISTSSSSSAYPLAGGDLEREQGKLQ